MAETGGEGFGLSPAISAKVGAGAAKYGKKAAESEAGRSAGRAAMKGAYEGASQDVRDRYTHQGEYAQQTQTQRTSQPKQASDGSTFPNPSFTDTGGESSGFYSMLSSGAAKYGKKAAESEAGHSAGRAAMKGAYEGASQDVRDRYTHQGEYAQQTQTQRTSQPKQASDGSTFPNPSFTDTGGESSGLYSMLGSGAAKYGKKAAESEAGRSAGRAAMKGTYEGASHDVHDRYMHQGEYAQQTQTHSSSPTKPPSGGTTAHSATLIGTGTPPRSNHPRPKNPSRTTRPASKSKSSPRTQAKGRVYSHRLAKEPDWDRQLLGQALYNFRGEMKCDLEFRKGQVITILTRTEQQFDWWEGKLDDRVGIFPANYVKLLY